MIWWPPVGVFIALLAVIGVVVPWVKETHTKHEKAAWTMVMFVLVAMEIFTIHDDRNGTIRSSGMKGKSNFQSFRLLLTA
jgi:hypothetical protein